jgi:iron complex outermembrane receptor protein
MQGQGVLGRLSLTGALSLVDSRVRNLANGYTGELVAGDRMLEVPSRTVSFTASWSAAAWGTSWTAARASDWINYDRIQMAESLGSAGPALTRLSLREYWLRYPGSTRLRATFSRDLFRSFSLVVTGDNLLGYQRGEPDNLTIVPGRTITAGIRARF